MKTKNKENLEHFQRGKNITYIGQKIQVSSDLAETLEAKI